MTFNINGENMTNLIRTTFVEGRLSVSKDLCDGCGLPEEYWIPVCTGTSKMIGDSNDNSLSVEDDDTKSHNGINIDLESIVARFEQKFAEFQLDFINAETRIRYYTLRVDYEGVLYRSDSKRIPIHGDTPRYSLKSDKFSVECIGEKLSEMEPLFSWLYPALNKDPHNYMMEDYIDTEHIFQPDMEANYYLPNMRNNIKTVSGKMVEEEYLNSSIEPHTLPNVSKFIRNQEHKITNVDLNTSKENYWGIKTGLDKDSEITQKYINWFNTGGNIKCDDIDLVKTIPLNIGDGVIYYEGKDLRKLIGSRNGNEITLKINTWIGISLNAIHYYGRLEGPRFSWNIENSDCSTSGKEFEFTKKIDIKLTHPLKSWEVREYPDRFKGFTIGGPSDSFYSKEDIIIRAKEIFSKWFEPEGWILIIED